MQRYFDRGMLAVLGLLLAVTVANGVVAYHHIRELYEARAGMALSRQMQLHVQQVLTSALDAESAVRGFVVTGESSDLEPYDAAAVRIGAQLDQVAELAAGDSVAVELLHELRARLEAHMVELASVLAVRREDGFEAAASAIRTGRGRAKMDALREVVRQLHALEVRRLDEQSTASVRSLDIARASSAFAALLALTMLAALMHQTRRNLVARDRDAAVLGEQKELFRTTLASLGEAVVTCDTMGRVTFLNATAEALTGWSAARAVGQPIADIVRVVEHGSHRPVENSAELALCGVTVAVEHRGALVARGAGPERPVEDSAAPLYDAAGSIAGAVLVFRDITERQRSEDALREADRRKDEFLAVLAHELRNPLAPLRNALQIVRLGGNRGGTEKVWGMMERQVAQMVRLIDDLLDVSRITRGKIELRREPVDVSQVIEAALEMSAPMVARYDQQVESEVQPELPPIEGDRARLVQVVSNLVTNAAKYSEPGGHIRVHARMAEGRLHIVVKDTGVGIPPEMLERIFDMFTQVDRTLERTRGGLGIGLTLVRRLVELHGGSIVARSEGAGHGSEFEIVLPFEAARVIPPPAEESGEVAGVARRVLVTDDNEDAAESLARMLRMMGHEVRIASDGEHCIAACEEFRPDVVLLDIGMPKMNGYDAARIIRSRPWGTDVLIVALTGWGQEEDRRRAREAGIDHHLVKPAEFTRLARILHAGRRATRAHA
jgi:PAS domain S-box-containing protein